MSRQTNQPQHRERPPTVEDGPQCPICAAPADQSDDAFPFCSRRCRMVDLSRWLGGRYVVSRPLNDDDLSNLG